MREQEGSETVHGERMTSKTPSELRLPNDCLEEISKPIRARRVNEHTDSSSHNRSKDLKPRFTPDVWLVGLLNVNFLLSISRQKEKKTKIAP